MNVAYVSTLCNGAAYTPGLEALGKSLEASGTSIPRLLQITSDVSEEARRRVEACGWRLLEIEPIENPVPEKAQLYGRFAHTFNKLRAWDVQGYAKLVYLDADTIVLKNVDDLFERPAFAAGPDFFLPDRFNSGVMVIEPSKQLFARMIDVLASCASYDGGDQGFLNSFIGDWYAMPVAHRLPVGYNMQHFIYQFLHGHPSLAAQLESEVKIVHYSVQKPWLARSTLTGASSIWWSAYFQAHPEQASSFRRRLHSLEDHSFDMLATALIS